MHVYHPDEWVGIGNSWHPEFPWKHHYKHDLLVLQTANPTLGIPKVILSSRPRREAQGQGPPERGTRFSLSSGPHQPRRTVLSGHRHVRRHMVPSPGRGLDTRPSPHPPTHLVPVHRLEIRRRLQASSNSSGGRSSSRSRTPTSRIRRLLDHNIAVLISYSPSSGRGRPGTMAGSAPLLRISSICRCSIGATPSERSFVAAVLQVCPNVETVEITDPMELSVLAPLPPAVRTSVLRHLGVALSWKRYYDVEVVRGIGCRALDWGYEATDRRPFGYL